MVIGNGMLGKAFEDYKYNDKYLIFASGVSNSKSVDQGEFDREVSLIKKTIAEFSNKRHLIYFSTCSIDDPEFRNSMYVKHKIFIENLISHNLNNYTIFRLSNIVGETMNKNTVFHYIKTKIEKQETFEIWKNAERNFIEINQLVEIIDLFLRDIETWNAKIINIGNFVNTKIIDLVGILEKRLNKKSLAVYLEKGGTFDINLSILESVIASKKPNFSFYSIEDITSKYINL